MADGIQIATKITPNPINLIIPARKDTEIMIKNIQKNECDRQRNKYCVFCWELYESARISKLH